MKPSVPLVVPLISFCIAAVSISVCHTCSPLGVMLLLYAVAFAVAVAVAVAVADTLQMLSLLLFWCSHACFQFDHVFSKDFTELHDE